MEASEYVNLARQEEVHWYYAGKREMVKYWLNRTTALRPDGVLLDCGAGTGRFAQEMQAFCRVLVLDDHEEALGMLREKFAADQVLALADGAIPLPDRSVDMLTALDVLEHIPDDRSAVREFARVLKSGGTTVITVPACRSLWSDWDVALHHQRRYRLGELKALFATPEWEILHVAYTNVLVFPLVWLIRRVGGTTRRGSRSPLQRAEDRIPPRWLNAVLKAMFVVPARTRLPFPFGVSLILVAKRR